MKFYDFSAKKMNGQEVKMEAFKGKVVLVVNTASKCGLTPQFTELEELNKKYKEEGLEILGFPCNQFAHQDKGSNEEIQEFCSLNYGVTFNMFQKIEVNGENAHPLYKFLKNAVLPLPECPAIITFPFSLSGISDSLSIKMFRLTLL